MKKAVFALVFLTALVLALAVGHSGASQYDCRSNQWPAFHPSISHQERPGLSLIPSQSSGQQSHFVGVHDDLPLLCTELDGPDFQVWRITHTHQRTSARLQQGNKNKVLFHWPFRVLMGQQVLIFREDQPGRVMLKEVRGGSRSLFYLPPKMLKGHTIVFQRLHAEKRIALSTRPERLLTPGSQHQAVSVGQRPRCYRLPKTTKLRRRYVYRITEKFAGGLSSRYLRIQPKARPPAPRPARAMTKQPTPPKTLAKKPPKPKGLARPLNQSIPFQHHGTCKAHSAYLLSSPMSTPGRWVRWQVKDARGAVVQPPMIGPRPIVSTLHNKGLKQGQQYSVEMQTIDHRGRTSAKVSARLTLRPTLSAAQAQERAEQADLFASVINGRFVMLFFGLEALILVLALAAAFLRRRSDAVLVE